MKKLYFIWLFSCLNMLGNSQIILIKDMESGKPLESVTILSDRPAAFSITNANGQADISAFAACTKIQIQLLGYQILTKSFADIEQQGFTILLENTGLSMGEVVISVSR